MTITFQGRSSVGWSWRTFRANKHQQNDRKCWKNSRTQPWWPAPNNPWARRHRWDQLWSLPGDLNGKFEHVPHCSLITTTRPPTRPWKPQWVTNNNVVIVPHTPYSPDLAPCDFVLFPKLKMKLKGRRFESVWHTKGIATGTRQHWGKWLPRCFRSVEKIMGSLYTFPMRLFWKRWQPKLSKLSQHFFFDLVRKLSDRISYVALWDIWFLPLRQRHRPTTCWILVIPFTLDNHCDRDIVLKILRLTQCYGLFPMQIFIVHQIKISPKTSSPPLQKPSTEIPRAKHSQFLMVTCHIQ
jgi:hypothetical protein